MGGVMQKLKGPTAVAPAVVQQQQMPMQYRPQMAPMQQQVPQTYGSPVAPIQQQVPQTYGSPMGPMQQQVPQTYGSPMAPMQQQVPQAYGSSFGQMPPQLPPRYGPMGGQMPPQLPPRYGPMGGQSHQGFGQSYPNSSPMSPYSFQGSMPSSNENDMYFSNLYGISPTEVGQLRLEFNNYATAYGIIDRAGFKKLYVASLINKPWEAIDREAEMAFRNFDNNQTGGLDFNEYMTACARMMRENPQAAISPMSPY